MPKKTKIAKKNKPKGILFQTFLRHLNKMSPIVVMAFLLTPVMLIFMPRFEEVASTPLVTRSSLLSGFPSVSDLPKTKGVAAPVLSARNIFIWDLNSKVVLYQKNADQQVYPASTTKMMTALVVLEHFPLDQVITVTREYPIGQHIGFTPGEKITVENLLYALLVQSGNDAAEILAENYPDGRPAFVAAMNAKAKSFHLANTHFQNPTGIDEVGHYSTATDLARLADVALRNSEFSKIVGTENAVVTSSDYTTSHILNNVNQLLGKVFGVKGIKTGYTEGAGQSLVTLVERDGHPVIIVVLGSADRFTDSRVLIDWVYDNFTWEAPTPSSSQ